MYEETIGELEQSLVQCETLVRNIPHTALNQQFGLNHVFYWDVIDNSQVFDGTEYILSYRLT